MTTPIAQVLYEAAADVDRRGVMHPPVIGEDETCAVISLDNWVTDFRLYRRLLGISFVKGRHDILDVCPIAEWNDTQPSRAVVAAEMRSAAQLAELIGHRL